MKLLFYKLKLMLVLIYWVKILILKLILAFVNNNHQDLMEDDLGE